MYQKNYKAKVLVIYCVLSQSKTIDKKLVQKILWDRNYTKYVSFWETYPNIRLGTLYLNNIKNVKGKYEVLEKVLVID